MIKLEAIAERGSGQYIAQITGRVDTNATFERKFLGRKVEKDRTEVLIDYPGLFEECDIYRDEKTSTFYLIYQRDLESEDFYYFEVTREDAMRIAKALDKRSFYECVKFSETQNHLIDFCVKRLEHYQQEAKKNPGKKVVIEGWSILAGGRLADKGTFNCQEIADAFNEYISELVEGKHPNDKRWGWEHIKPAEAAKIVQAQTVEQATTMCWEIIQALPEKEAKKVLAQLKSKLNPKAEEVEQL